MEGKTRNNVDPVHYEAARFAMFYVAFIDGISPALTVIISLTPSYIHENNLVSSAYTASILLSLAVLFLLGVYLGKIAKDSGWLYGIAMITVGD
ncbi:hypothetical protein KEJ32_01905 [Candidatus Bathyarchaeota archaeon]|nr:hypothetical protein [Candidatus Bathyarchaeota archaeon]